MAYTIGRYIVCDEIASGGMATVHVGKLVPVAGFSKIVAIKKLYPEFARNPEFVTRFLDEARIASRVSHPNVVQVLDVVPFEEGVYLVLDYVDGASLAELVRATGRPISPRIAVAVVL